MPKLQFQTHYPGIITKLGPVINEEMGVIQKMAETANVDGGIQICLSKDGSKLSIHSKSGETRSNKIEVVHGIRTQDGNDYNPRAPNTTEIQLSRL